MSTESTVHMTHQTLNPLTILGISTVLGYYAGQVARLLRLPSLIGYMLLGVIVGPSLLGLFDHAALQQMTFITEVALGCVAFSIGAELNLTSLKKLGSGIISIIFAESLTAFFVVLGLVYGLTWLWGAPNLPLALIFGAVAPASAPAGTVAVIQEYRAKGSLTQALYAVVGFDDGLAILLFGFAAALAKSILVSAATGANESILASMAAPALEIVLSVLIGSVIGLVFCQLVRHVNKSTEMLILVFGMILITSGIATRFHLSLILTNMMVGFLLVNTRRESLVSKVVAPLHDIMPLLFVLFFCLAGAHLDILKLPALGVLGIVYIVGRTAGLIGGARIGATLGHVEEKIKTWIGLGILSQAGVAIGLSLIIQHDFSELVEKYDFSASEGTLYHPTAIGATVITTITATCIFFEIIGPILTKIALENAGEINAAPAPEEK